MYSFKVLEQVSISVCQSANLQVCLHEVSHCPLIDSSKSSKSISLSHHSSNLHCCNVGKPVSFDYDFKVMFHRDAGSPAGICTGLFPTSFFAYFASHRLQEDDLTRTTGQTRFRGILPFLTVWQKKKRLAARWTHAAVCKLESRWFRCLLFWSSSFGAKFSCRRPQARVVSRVDIPSGPRKHPLQRHILVNPTRISPSQQSSAGEWPKYLDLLRRTQLLSFNHPDSRLTVQTISSLQLQSVRQSGTAPERSATKCLLWPPSYRSPQPRGARV